ncbi:MAG: uracil-DNA glycosylase [Planctomycetota bacterium]
MKKQAVARLLVRELQARVALDRSFGAEFQRIPLPEPLDLTHALDPEGEEDRPSPEPVRARTEPMPRPASQGRVPFGPLSAKRETPAAPEFRRAAGLDLPPFEEAIPPDEREAALLPVREAALACTLCPLSETRTRVVFGEGSLTADLVFVGEAPGRDEDLQGRPFVGRAGELLTAMIERGMKRPRGSVYICNILKCRPPQNRDPQPGEVRACTPYLCRQLETIRPRLIVALGRIAAQLLSGEPLSMKRLRGRFLSYRGIPLLPVYHPAYLLRVRGHAGAKTEEDRQTWEDLQKAMAFLSTPG